MHLVLIVNILPIFMKGGQELKAHLSIKKCRTGMRRTIPLLLVIMFLFVSIFPIGSALLRSAGLPISHLYCLVLFTKN